MRRCLGHGLCNAASMQLVALGGGLYWASGKPHPRFGEFPFGWKRMAYRDPFRHVWLARGLELELATHLAALKTQNRTVELFEFRYSVRLQVAEFLAGDSDGAVTDSLDAR